MVWQVIVYPPSQFLPCAECGSALFECRNDNAGSSTTVTVCIAMVPDVIGIVLLVLGTFQAMLVAIIIKLGRSKA